MLTWTNESLFRSNWIWCRGWFSAWIQFMCPKLGLRLRLELEVIKKSFKEKYGNTPNWSGKIVIFGNKIRQLPSQCNSGIRPPQINLLVCVLNPHPFFNHVPHFFKLQTLVKSHIESWVLSLESWVLGLESWFDNYSAGKLVVWSLKKITPLPPFQKNSDTQTKRLICGDPRRFYAWL